MDDILLAGSDVSEMTNLKSFLDHQFKIKDLGLVHYFLGLEISSHDTRFLIHQHKYASNLLAEFSCSNYTPVASPLEPSVKLVPVVNDILPDPSIFRRLVGKLNFLQHTRPDIYFAVQHLSQFLQAPCAAHMKDDIHRFVTSYYIVLGGCPISWKSKKQPTIALFSAETEYRALCKVVAEPSCLTYFQESGVP
ncbi:uncharacterized mitochondrial protein AtMg00810-like [Capsicum annuum]|uniref:uncharacterized mitochondrial protein AtMg00810-like n=1 Tax=Capsicum annuum TaxID=4072 RepID=UPI001FB072E7|nr:uncharacterized mitochondrial protein AtMg00810-like [Capsicum annuum]